MGNRVLISRLHSLAPVTHRFNAEKRGEKWRIGYASDDLRNRTLRYMGSTISAVEAWKCSNCGISYISWSGWISGNKLPAKYHMALDRFLTEQGH